MVFLFLRAMSQAAVLARTVGECRKGQYPAPWGGAIDLLMGAGGGKMRNGGSKEPLNSIFPDSALIDIRTPKRPDVDHETRVLGGKMRNLK